MEINRHEIWQTLTQLTLMRLKYIKGIFSPTLRHKIYPGNVQSKCRLAQFFLDTLTEILRKKSEVVGEFFLQLCKCNSVDFIEISENRCANTNLH